MKAIFIEKRGKSSCCRRLLFNGFSSGYLRCTEAFAEGLDNHNENAFRKSFGSTVLTLKALKSLPFLVTIISHPKDLAHVASRQSSKSGAFIK